MLFATFVFTSLQCAMAGTLFRRVGGNLDVDVPLNSLPFLYVVSPNHELLCVIIQINETMEIFPGRHKMFRCRNSTEMGKVKMSLTNITREDAGPYGWSQGSMQRTNGTLMTLFVTDRPTLPTIHLLETPVFGHQVTLRCDSNSTTIPANHSLVMGYQWLQYNQLLGNNSNIAISGQSLIITHLKSRREHQYECLATERESESPMATLKFTPEYGPYDLDVNVSGTARLEEDSSLSVSCAADCRPACTYMWLKQERRLHESGMMVLQRVRRMQSGYYSCKASNIHGDLEKPVLVDVLYQPHIVKGATFTRTQTINEGQEVDMRCDVDSNPPPTTTWLKDGITVKQRVLDGDVPTISGAQHIFNNIFTKQSAVCRDSGRYRCQAKNGVGTVAEETVTLSVMCSVRMAGDHPRSFITPRGTTQNVTLDVIAYPEPEFVGWKHIVGGKEAVVHEQRFIMTLVAMPNEFEHRVILTHIDVMDSDQGEYSTEMTNGVGRSLEYSYNITVQVPPKAPEDLTVAFVGETHATIKWREGFNGHAIQHFEISFKHARATKDQPWTVDPTMINEGTTQVNLRGLDERTEYRIRVRAWNDIGTSGYSNELIIQTQGQGKTHQAENRSEPRDREGQTSQRTLSDHASSDESSHVKENETSFSGFYPESHGSRITGIVFALIGTSLVFLIVWFLLLKGPLKCMLMRLGVSLNQHRQIRELENSYELSTQGDCGAD